MARSQTSATADFGLLLMRLMLAAVFMFHGSQKLFSQFDGGGMEKFTESVKSLELIEGFTVPEPEIAAYAAACAEFYGGIALLIGLLTRIATIPMIGTMLVAAFGVHKTAFSLQHGGMEYALTLAVMLTAILLIGPGRFSLDHVFFRKRPTIGEPRPKY